MTFRTRAPRKGSRWLVLMALVAVSTVVLATTALASPSFTFTPDNYDQQGANDEPGQKDLTAQASITDSGNFWTAWRWDDTSWSGKNSGDGCSLFSSDGDGFADYAVCATIGGKTVALSTVTVYQCSDGRVDRCTNPVLLPVTSPITNLCHLESSFVQGTFDATGVGDTEIHCDITAINGALVSPSSALAGSSLINTCSYPSREPNSDPSDCIFEEIPVPPSLTLNKVVTRNNGGTALESSWTLTATGALDPSTDLSGPGAAGSADVVSGATFKPDTYTLAESGSVAGYTNGGTYSCVKTPAGGTAGAPVVSNTITLAAGDSAICTITNDDNAPSLTLNKVVTSDQGLSAAESSWTLTATGALDPSTDLSGPGAAGSADVASGATFKADTYTLAESGTVAGYTNGTTYSCVKTPAGGAAGSAVVSNTITLAVGDSAICTITNTDNPATPAIRTAQGWSLFDTAHISGIRGGAPDAGTATVTFKLWSDADCSVQVGTEREESISAAGVATTSTGIVVTPTTSPSTFYWTADYSGDAFNSPISSECGTETTTISWAQPAAP